MARQIKQNRKNKVDKRENEKSKQLKEQQYEKIRETIKLANDQVEATEYIKENDITILLGKAGSGKTLLSCYVAIQSLLKREVSKIILTRPQVGTEDMGFIKGGIAEKYDPWLAPLYQNFGKILNEGQLKGLMTSKRIEMLPLQFTRGITYDDAYVIIDECLLPNQKILLSSGKEITIEDLYTLFHSNQEEKIFVKSFNLYRQAKTDNAIVYVKKKKVTEKSYKITLKNGSTLLLTENHKLFVKDKGYTKVKDIIKEDLLYEV